MHAGLVQNTKKVQYLIAQALYAASMAACMQLQKFNNYCIGHDHVVIKNKFKW